MNAQKVLTYQFNMLSANHNMKAITYSNK